MVFAEQLASAISGISSNETPNVHPWEKYGGFMIWLAAMFYVFLGFEVLCDEWFVPALNQFCERLGMPDDFAGATLMGLGSCAPDVFSGILGVLVLHTDVGAGTIVGSLLFNHLAILGGICLAVPSFRLKLSSFTREVIFYAVSLGLLLGSLWDHKVTVYESSALLGTYVLFCIVCGFTPRLTVLFSRIFKRFSKEPDLEKAEAKAPLLINEEPMTYIAPLSEDHGSLDSPTTTSSDGGSRKTSLTDFAAQFSSDLEIVAGKHSPALPATEPAQPAAPAPDMTVAPTTAVLIDGPEQTKVVPSSAPAPAPAPAPAKLPPPVLTAPVPVRTTTPTVAASVATTSATVPISQDVTEVVAASVPVSGRFGSDVPAKVQEQEPGKSAPHGFPRAITARDNRRRLKETATQVFQTIKEKEPELPSGKTIGLGYGSVHLHGFLQKKSAWYTKIRVSSRQWQTRWFVLDEGLWYCRNPLFPAVQKRIVPLWAAFKIEREAEDPCAFKLFTKRSTYTFRADTAARATQWIDALSTRIALQRRSCPDLITDEGLIGIDDDEVESVWSPPPGWPQFIIWILSLPLFAVFTVTIPNVKYKRCKNLFVVTFVMVLAWLGAMSYGMLWAADRFATILGIPEDITGLTITAIGASLPSFFGSVIAARQGATDMAVSNTFGANLSSILVALGLPTFIQTAIVTPGKPYILASEGIVKTVAILGVALIIFLISIFISRMRLNKILGVFYLILYAVLLSLVVVLEVFHVNF